jgi:transposase
MIADRCPMTKTGYLKKRGQQRTDSTHVLGAIRELNRLEMVGETLRHALDSLAVVVPEWSRAPSQPEWLERYGSRVQNYRLPKSQAERDAYAEQIGADGLALLQAIFNERTTAWLTEIPAVRILYKVWIQNHTWKTEEQLHWRQPDEPPLASFPAGAWKVLNADLVPVIRPMRVEYRLVVHPGQAQQPFHHGPYEG